MVVGTPNQQGVSNPGSISANGVGGISGLKVQPDFRIEGNTTVAFATTQNGNVTGSVTLRILNPEPIGVFLNDLGFNGSSSLPEGISVVVTSGGVQFPAERLSTIGSVMKGESPLVPTSGLTTASFTYLIHVSNAVAPGTYDVILYFVSFHAGGSEIFSGYTFTVVLSVS
ncbi:MAG: hypothetical protein QXX17_05075 [Conexivisphaerales archaeon]